MKVVVLKALPLAVLLLFVVGGCTSFGGSVSRLAASDLSCAPAELRVQAIGELELLSSLTLRLYQAEGCQQERTYYCHSQRGCASQLQALGLDAATRHEVARALHVRRTTSRARCPSDAERVVQQSQSLYRFEACDRDVIVHCRARGCETLGTY